MPNHPILHLAGALALAAASAPPPLQAQSAPTVDRTVRAEVIDHAADALAQTYVEPDTGRMIANLLRRRLAEGAYDRYDNPAQFADAATRDMRSLNGDLHLGLSYSPPVPASGAGGGGGPADSRARNFGLGRVEVLPGNVGYLEITGFLGAQGYRDVVVDALRFLARTQAVIIDVRRNGGGSGEMSHFVFSHFLGAEPVPTIRVKRRTGEPAVRRSFAEVPGPRRTDVPLYVLTSQGTASAAEEFSFVLRNQGRATIVGTRTAGAGHMVTGVPAGHGFTTRISITRVMDPATGAEWEGAGVQPHLAVDAADALDAAQEAALTRLRERLGPDATRDRLLETLSARRAGTRAEPSDLARWAGEYEGRSVRVVEGTLWYGRRPGALHEPLVPLGDGRFGLGATRFLFETQGGVTSLTIELSEGTSVTFERK